MPKHQIQCILSFRPLSVQFQYDLSRKKEKTFSLFWTAQICAITLYIWLPTILASISYIHIVFHILIVRS